MAESTEAEESASAPQCDKADVYTQAILGFFSKMQAERTRLRQTQEAKIVQQQEQPQREQRVAARGWSWTRRRSSWR